jgi:hypothetical protein
MKPRTLKTLLQRLNSINWINNGGCGISALVIYKWLKENNKRNIEFMFLYNQESVYKTNSRKLSKGNKHLVSPSHVVVLWRGKIIDSNGIKTNSYTQLYDYSHIIDDINFLIGSINFSEWNDMFNRKESIPIIQEITGINIKEVKIK